MQFLYNWCWTHGEIVGQNVSQTTQAPRLGRYSNHAMDFLLFFGLFIKVLQRAPPSFKLLHKHLVACGPWAMREEPIQCKWIWVRNLYSLTSHDSIWAIFLGGSICHLHPRLCARADVNHASEASKSWVYPEFWGNFSHRYHQSRFCIHILISSKGHPIMLGCQWWQWSLYIHHFLTMARFYWWSLLDPVVCSCWSKNMTPPEQINRNGGKHTIHAPHGLGIWVLGCPRIGYQKSRLHHHTYI